MTYEEAEKYMKENESVVGNYFHDKLSFKIKALLIAPKERSNEDRAKVLMESYTYLGNEGALKKLGFINDKTWVCTL